MALVAVEPAVRGVRRLQPRSGIVDAAAIRAWLLAHGHRRIAFLGDPRRIPTAAERYTGYAAAMADHGLQVDLALVHHDLHGQHLCDTAIARLLDDFPADRRPTALFTSQNVITIAAVRGLQDRGLEHEVALVGFDDFPLAELVRPGVTVVAQDPRAIGLYAARTLFARLDGAPPHHGSR